MARYKAVLLIGVPGAGKGTQGKILGRIPAYFHCASGDVFRQIDRTSDDGRLFYEYSSRGELVPDEVTVRIWSRAMAGRVEADQYKPERDLLVLDGIPRTFQQAQIMDSHIKVLKIIHLVCHDPEIMLERVRCRVLKENRDDDADEQVIRRRWTVYEKETAPVLTYYPKQVVSEIDAVGTPGQILRHILAIVVPIHDRHFAAFEG